MDERIGNQKFTVRVTVEFDVWPGLPDRNIATIEACMKSKGETMLRAANIIGKVVSSEVVGVVGIPIGG